MSQAIDLERESQHLHTIDHSTLRDSSASYPQQEKGDAYCEAPCSGSSSPSETVYYLHAQDNFPDGGLRAWLVVLGVRPCVFICGWCDKLNFRVHARLSQRELRFSDHPSKLIVPFTDSAM